MLLFLPLFASTILSAPIPKDSNSAAIIGGAVVGGALVLAATRFAPGSASTIGRAAATDGAVVGSEVVAADVGASAAGTIATDVALAGKSAGTNGAANAAKTSSTWFPTWKQSYASFKSWMSAKGATNGEVLSATGNPLVEGAADDALKFGGTMATEKAVGNGAGSFAETSTAASASGWKIPGQQTFANFKSWMGKGSAVEGDTAPLLGNGATSSSVDKAAESTVSTATGPTAWHRLQNTMASVKSKLTGNGWTKVADDTAGETTTSGAKFNPLHGEQAPNPIQGHLDAAGQNSNSAFNPMHL
jgi:hypothetical protein